MRVFWGWGNVSEVNFREFYATLQGDESVPGALYSIMLSPVARKEPEVMRQGTWKYITLTFKRWKESFAIWSGLVALPSNFQIGDGFSLKKRAETSIGRQRFGK